MSTLHDRIAAQPAVDPTIGHHPVGTSATPMVMPMSELTYDGNVATYGQLHPLVTADGAVVASRSHASHAGRRATVYPAGQP